MDQERTVLGAYTDLRGRELGGATDEQAGTFLTLQLNSSRTLNDDAYIDV